MSSNGIQNSDLVRLVRCPGNTCGANITKQVFIPPHPYVAPAPPRKGPIRSGEKYDYICKYSDIKLIDCVNLTVENAKGILLQILYALKHLHTRRNIKGNPNQYHYTVGPSLRSENIRFSEDMKNILLAHFEALLNGDASIDICQLHDIFEFVLDKCTGDYDIDYWKRKRNDSESIIAHLIESTRKRMFGTVDDILKHPFFWSTEKKISFLVRVRDIGSQREHLRRDINGLWEETGWIDKLIVQPYELKHGLDKKAVWLLTTKAEQPYQNTIYDLLRFIRNVKAHFWDGDNRSAQLFFGNSDSDGIYNFFMKKFPNLFSLAYICCKKQQWKDHFKNYFDHNAKCYDLTM